MTMQDRSRRNRLDQTAWQNLAQYWEKAILFCWQIVLLFVLPFLSRPAILYGAQRSCNLNGTIFAHSFIFEWGKFDTIQ
jgi:hypothetical protein